jgi:hypothetical protein
VWLAALAGRLAFLLHRASGHAATWKTSSPNPDVCAGDIVCHECGQVLWCRAHDPWRNLRGEAPPDHWGGTRAQQHTGTLFECLQQVLRLAEACPSGVWGDEIRRAACELVEADSLRRRTACRRRMLKYVVGIRARDQLRTEDLREPLLGRLADALRRESSDW